MKIRNINREEESGRIRYNAQIQTNSTLFEAIEEEFDKWIDQSNPAMEYAEKYFSDEAIYSKKRAIISAIDHIYEVMDEEDVNFIYLNDCRIDLSSVFAD